MDQSSRREMINNTVGGIRPENKATNLDDALVTVAESFQTNDDDDSSRAGKRPGHIVLITDLQRGSRVDSARRISVAGTNTNRHFGVSQPALRRTQV